MVSKEGNGKQQFYPHHVCFMNSYLSVHRRCIEYFFSRCSYFLVHLLIIWSEHSQNTVYIQMSVRPILQTDGERKECSHNRLVLSEECEQLSQKAVACFFPLLTAVQYLSLRASVLLYSRTIKPIRQNTCNGTLSRLYLQVIKAAIV